MSTKAIIIGLGGVGSEIVHELEEYLAEEKRDSSSIRLVTMDTDVNTLARLKRDGFSGRMVVMSERMTVGEYLQKNKGTEEWFLGNRLLDWKPVTEGAGQVRAVSRLAFEMAARSGKLQPLYEAIQELHTLSSSTIEEAAFRIIIVSTLAGGTGSGVMLPLAFHLRKYIDEVYKRKDVIIRGMFLLSDCLDRVVEDENERKSLRGNTYAAIKELDAFMKKADGYLPARYSQVYMKNSFLSESDNYLSYNFCYLFSTRNEMNGGLRSFPELKKYILQCIDAQILGPMQELNNSIEDNVLKSTMVRMQSKDSVEFNRYCACGIRVLQYPYEKIMEYLSLKKALDIFSNQWMEVDNAYRQEKEKQRARRESGYSVGDIPLGEFYMDYVTTADGRSEILQHVNQDAYEDENGIRIGRWEKYLNELEKEVKNSIDQLGGKWKNKFKQCRSIAKSIQLNRNERVRGKVEQLAEAYDGLIELMREEIGRAMVGVEQKYFNAVQTDPPLWHFLYWLKQGDGLMHLNSIRFFLYQAVRAMQGRYDRIEKALEENETVLQDIDKLKDRISEISSNWLGNTISGNLRYVLREYDKRLEEIESYCDNLMLKRVYGVGMERLQKNSLTLELFYENFDYNRMLFQDRLSMLFDHLTKEGGGVVRYVGADKEQLDSLSELIFDYNKDIETNRMLSSVIFEKLCGIVNRDKEEQKDCISEILQKDSVEFWKDNLKKNYASETDFTIAEAIIREGNQKRGRRNGHEYLRQVLEDTWKVTSPYLQIDSARSRGQAKKFCAYNSNIGNGLEQTEEILKAQLKQKGGTETDEVDKYKIIFYRVLYNLRASDVRELSDGMTNFNKISNGRISLGIEVDGGGNTFQDYYDIVKMQNFTMLTPHIDQHWSNILAMPDPNAAFTQYLEKQVYKALCIMWVEGNISIVPIDENKDTSGKAGYSCEIGGVRKNFESIREILSSLADKIWYVDEKLRNLEERVKKDLDVGKEFDESYFGACLQEENIFHPLVRYLKEIPKVRWDSVVMRNMAESFIELLQALIEAYYLADNCEQKLMHIITRGVRGMGSSNESVFCRNIINDVLRQMGLYTIRQ